MVKFTNESHFVVPVGRQALCREMFQINLLYVIGLGEGQSELVKGLRYEYLKRNEMLPLLLFSQQHKLGLKLLPEYFTK